jgi:hypothetical protein
MAYLVNQGNNLRVELTYGSRTAQSPNQAPVTENYWSFGIKTAIFYRPSDF